MFTRHYGHFKSNTKTEAKVIRQSDSLILCTIEELEELNNKLIDNLVHVYEFFIELQILNLFSHKAIAETSGISITEKCVFPSWHLFSERTVWEIKTKFKYKICGKSLSLLMSFCQKQISKNYLKARAQNMLFLKLH